MLYVLSRVVNETHIFCLLSITFKSDVKFQGNCVNLETFPQTSNLMSLSIWIFKTFMMFGCSLK